MKKILYTIFTSVLISLSFTSCFDPIFSNIRKEVPLNEASISGFINKTVRVGSGDNEYMFLENGLLYCKKIATTEEEASDLHQQGKWTLLNCFGEVKYNYYATEEDNFFTGLHIYNLASDENYLYAIGYTPTQNDTEGVNLPDKIKVYCLAKSFIPDGMNTRENWKEVTAINTAIADYVTECKNSSTWPVTKYFLKNLSIALFSTEDKDTESNREAYIRIGGGCNRTTSEQKSSTTDNYWSGTENQTGKIYKLNGVSGESLLATVSKDDNSETKTLGQPSIDTVSAVKFNGTTYFFDRLVSGKYESFDDAGNGTDQFIYCAVGSSSFYWATDTSSFGDSTSDASCEATFSYKSDLSLGYDMMSSAYTADSIIIGSKNGGVFRLPVESNAPASSKGSFTSNAADIMASPYIIRMLFCEDPSKVELEATLYSSMDFYSTDSNAGADYDNRCLWSYYPNRQDGTEYSHWNRE